MALVRTDSGIWVSANTIGTTAFTTGAFTPPDNSLLIVACGTMRESLTDTTLGRPTITDSLGTPLTYTQIDFTNLTAAYATQMTVWRAPVVGTGVSMTITVDDPNNFDMYGYQVCVFAFTGYDTSTPVTGTIDTDTTNIADGAHSLTLTAAPTVDDYSLIFLHLDADGANANPTLAAGWTEAFDNGTSGGGGTLVGLHRTASTSTTASVTDVYTGTGSFIKGSMLTLNVKAAAAAAAAGAQIYYKMLRGIGL